MAMALWRIEMFGGLSARQGDRLVTHFETRRAGALLACLALKLRGAHSREVLAEQLWPEEEGKAIQNRLRQALSTLRRELEPATISYESLIIADRFGVSLNPIAVSTDVADFEGSLAAAAEAAGPDERATLLRGAIKLYRGELLPGYHEEFLNAERERLAQSYRNALGQLSTALGQAGDIPGAIEAARIAVTEDCLREDIHCDLMRLFVMAGRTSEALRQY
ncbi:MAG: bacterial transcriptional activator domain-containing protein, partial [Chloroflexi bacterium]|nr:bacterial transcriptional activator domain-containing protein [Chloroflexota bacterium]